MFPILLPTTGRVCDLPLYRSFRLPTAGLCNQLLDTILRLLPATGVCDQHLGKYFGLLPTAVVCNQLLSAFVRYLPTTGVFNQAEGPKNREAAA